jgi:hypothetical protein
LGGTLSGTDLEVDVVDAVDVGLAAAVLAAETVNIIFWLK